MELFELATYRAFRFPSNKGEVTVEQLWQMPLQSKSGFDLDTVAKEVYAKVKGATEESFVEEVSPRAEDDQLKLNIVKHIIKFKLDQNKAQKDRVAKAQEKARLMEILSSKKDQELQSLSKEELEARIAAL